MKPGYYFGGPFMDGNLYQHGVFCSGIGYYPRRAGNSCSCYRSDFLYRKLFVEFNREAKTAKRTLFVSECPGCHERQLFPFSEEPIPRATYCTKCGEWANVEEESWEGTDFAFLLPTIPKSVRRPRT